MIKVLIVDDQSLVRTGIVSLLKDTPEIEVVGEASNGEEAIRMIKEKKCHPDIILMDIKMPGMGGLEATRKLLLIDHFKILVITTCDNEVFPMKFLEEGAVGYITKDADIEELKVAIHTLSQGKRYISAEVAQQLALRRYGQTDNQSPFKSLSKRELQVAMMIIQGKRAPEIANTLHLSPKTVNTYRYRIFEKLSIKSDVELTRLAIQYGLIDIDSDMS